MDERGIYGRHFIYYKASVFEGCTLEIGRIGNKVVNNSAADTVLVSVDGKLILFHQKQWKVLAIIFRVIR